MGRLSVQSSKEALVAVLLACFTIPEEVKNEGPIAEALWLIEKGHIQTHVLNVLNLNPSTFYRALKAKRNKRPTGKSGRPRLLCPEQEELLEKKVIEQNAQGEPIFVHDFTAMVCLKYILI